MNALVFLVMMITGLILWWPKNKAAHPADRVGALLSAQAGENESRGIYFLSTSTDPLEGSINHRPGTYYNTDYYHFDQYSLEKLPATGVYAGKFKDASVADKISRMNYDIHVGAVLELPGKILMFFASLIAASLPTADC